MATERPIISVIRGTLKNCIEDGNFLENHPYNTNIKYGRGELIFITFQIEKKRKIIQVKGTYTYCQNEDEFTFQFEKPRGLLSKIFGSS